MGTVVIVRFNTDGGVEYMIIMILVLVLVSYNEDAKYYFSDKRGLSPN